ncbi:hypothetical protein ACN6MY_18455 [Peribacillus sp. B-H-3]|uniref:hypothetical protein n=1 Tax=Peribacillus sp. B-H-3 TaxID=3400420 RepID=UPI003B01CBAC
MNRSDDGAGKKALPKEKALSDAYTQKYLMSQKEKEKGFYQLQSKTNGYTMLFPADASISESSTEINGDFFETYEFSESSKESNIMNEYKITFDNRAVSRNIEANLAQLSSYVDYQGEFKKIDDGEKTLYYAKNTFTYKGNADHRFFSYIKSNKTQNITIYYEENAMLPNGKQVSAESRHSNMQ